MKNALLYLAAATLGSAATANAQSAKTSPFLMPQEQHVVLSGPPAIPTNPVSSISTKMKHHQVHDAILNRLLGSGQPINAAKTTSTVTDERLIAKSYWGYADLDGSGMVTWLLLDSADYHYFGERRSWFNFNNMNYADYYSLYSSQPIGLGQVFGGRDRDGKSEILADSAHHYGPVSSATPEMYLTNYQVFDAADNITDYTDYYAPFGFGQRMMMSFDANNRPTSVKYLQYSGPGWDTAERRYVTYNADTVTSDSTAYYSSSWIPEYKLSYVYDGTGKTVSVSQYKYDAGSWYEAYRYDIDYYTSGKIRKMTTRFAPAAGIPLDTMEVDTIGWTAGVPYMTYMEGRYIDGGTISQQYLMTKHVNTADGLPDTTRTVQYNFSMTPADTMDMMTTYIYDSYANPTMSKTWGKTTPSAATYDTLNNIQHFYYELFTRDNTGVNNVATGDGFKVYPNPANNELFITQGTSTATLATVKMFDITGRSVLNTETTAGNVHISMSSLPQGTYLVLLQDANGNILQREKVVKL